MKNIKEAMDFGDFKDFFHKDKRKDFESGTHEILGILPDNAQQYYETIVSDAYKKCVERLAHYTGTSPQTVNLPGVYGQILSGLKKVQSIESKNTRFFENLALETVLELPEFKWIKQAYEDDEISFDIKLGTGELQNAISDSEKQAEEEQPKEDGDLTGAESANFEIAQEYMGDIESKLRRRLANVLTQGNAVNKMYLFNLVKDKLDEVDPNLVPLYGITTSGIQALYFSMPPNIEGFAAHGNNAEAAMGSEEVFDEGDGKYKIKARGQIFPYLIHEIVKGICEYISLSEKTSGTYEKDSLEMETPDMIAGPEFYKKLISLIPSDKIDLYPAVKQRLLEMNINSIKEVFAGGGKAHSIINNIIKQIEQEMGPDPEETYQDSQPEDSDDDDSESTYV